MSRRTDVQNDLADLYGRPITVHMNDDPLENTTEVDKAMQVAGLLGKFGSKMTLPKPKASFVVRERRKALSEAASSEMDRELAEIEAADKAMEDALADADANEIRAATHPDAIMEEESAGARAEHAKAKSIEESAALATEIVNASPVRIFDEAPKETANPFLKHMHYSLDDYASGAKLTQKTNLFMERRMGKVGWKQEIAIAKQKVQQNLAEGVEPMDLAMNYAGTFMDTGRPAMPDEMAVMKAAFTVMLRDIRSHMDEIGAYNGETGRYDLRNKETSKLLTMRAMIARVSALDHAIRGSHKEAGRIGSMGRAATDASLMDTDDLLRAKEGMGGDKALKNIAEIAGKITALDDDASLRVLKELGTGNLMNALFETHRGMLMLVNPGTYARVLTGNITMGGLRAIDMVGELALQRGGPEAYGRYISSNFRYLGQAWHALKWGVRTETQKQRLRDTHHPNMPPQEPPDSLKQGRFDEVYEPHMTSRAFPNFSKFDPLYHFVGFGLLDTVGGTARTSYQAIGAIDEFTSSLMFNSWLEGNAVIAARKWSTENFTKAELANPTPEMQEEMNGVFMDHMINPPKDMWDQAMVNKQRVGLQENERHLFRYFYDRLYRTKGMRWAMKWRLTPANMMIEIARHTPVMNLPGVVSDVMSSFESSHEMIPKLTGMKFPYQDYNPQNWRRGMGHVGTSMALGMSGYALLSGGGGHTVKDRDGNEMTMPIVTGSLPPGEKWVDYSNLKWKPNSILLDPAEIPGLEALSGETGPFYWPLAAFEPAGGLVAMLADATHRLDLAMEHPNQELSDKAFSAYMNMLMVMVEHTKDATLFRGLSDVLSVGFGRNYEPDAPGKPLAKVAGVAAETWLGVLDSLKRPGFFRTLEDKWNAPNYLEDKYAGTDLGNAYNHLMKILGKEESYPSKYDPAGFPVPRESFMGDSAIRASVGGRISRLGIRSTTLATRFTFNLESRHVGSELKLPLGNYPGAKMSDVSIDLNKLDPNGFINAEKNRLVGEYRNTATQDVIHSDGMFNARYKLASSEAERKAEMDEISTRIDLSPFDKKEYLAKLEQARFGNNPNLWTKEEWLRRAWSQGKEKGLRAFVFKSDYSELLQDTIGLAKAIRDDMPTIKINPNFEFPPEVMPQVEKVSPRDKRPGMEPPPSTGAGLLSRM